MPNNKSSLKEVTPAEIDRYNTLLSSLSAAERIKWAEQKFGKNLYALSSFGIDSALLLNHLSEIDSRVIILHINTGFLHPETLSYRSDLQKSYNLSLEEYGPSKQLIKDIEELRLWDGDIETYTKLTKHDPLTKAVNDLKIAALLTGVRADQTENRSGLGVIGYGNDSEIRIRPFIDWSKSDIEEYFAKNKLKRHPLYAKGYESLGDYHSTSAGRGRNGRTVLECGLHVGGRKLVKNTANNI